ncbi:MAG: hypothetical protein JWM57_852 [Phycisphaerales bacterium]|nr:hypothetical protein [Phycisphaerales bacterium]
MATPKKPAKAAKAAKSETSAADKPAHVAPVVNLSQAAQSAAMLLASRRRREAEAASENKADQVNAASFKKLKDGIGQPQYASNSPLSGLNKPAKPTGSAGFTKHLGQTGAGGANVARTGVPRRTSGG